MEQDDKQKERNDQMNEVQKKILRIIGSALFNRDTPLLEDINIELLLNESKAQAVFPIVFATIQDKIRITSDIDKRGFLRSDKYREYDELFLQSSISGIQNFAEHGELHELMTKNQIPYVVIKGIASAMYYPEPSLRNMGDVDFLVNQKDMSIMGKELKNAGFKVDHGDENSGIHIAYSRPPMSIWEMHRNVNGIPSGEIGKMIKTEMDKMIETSVLSDVDGIVCRVPDRFYHGLVLLLHTASHLTSEGIGLRHLCDWVVFSSAFSDSEFKELFSKKLKTFGLWQFAQTLTLLGMKYLGAPQRIWALEALEQNLVDYEVLEGLINDVFNGGNFGTKDKNRYREIKYISTRTEQSISDESIIKQGFKTLNYKAYRDYDVINRHRFLLPAGWIAEGIKYFGLLISGKRKSSDTKKMLMEASERKKIYSKLNLFITE